MYVDVGQMISAQEFQIHVFRGHVNAGHPQEYALVTQTHVQVDLVHVVDLQNAVAQVTLVLQAFASVVVQTQHVR